MSAAGSFKDSRVSIEIVHEGACECSPCAPYVYPCVGARH